jgi:peroxiredoxin
MTGRHRMPTQPSASRIQCKSIVFENRLSMKWRSLEEASLQEEVRSLHDVHAERKSLIAKYVPAEIQAVHARAVEQLSQSGIVKRTLQVGAKAYGFELPDQNGRLVRSTDLLATGRLVIFFIRGWWCPFCVGQVEAMNAIVPKLQELKTSLVAISPQTVHQCSLMADQHHLQFPLLSDEGNRVARQFGLVYRVPEYQQEIYQRAFVNLPFVNGDSSWELPIPAVYVLGQQASADSSVLYTSPNPDYTERPEPDEILTFLSRLPG